MVCGLLHLWQHRTNLISLTLISAPRLIKIPIFINAFNLSSLTVQIENTRLRLVLPFRAPQTAIVIIHHDANLS